MSDKDIIYRQAAVDALWKALFKCEDDMEKQFQESDELDINEWILHRIFIQNMSDIDRQTILNLPSAQPKQCSDCIANGGDWECDHIHCRKGQLPFTQPDNQTHLCDSCDYLYPDCPSKNDDVIFGNGIGNDNICACNKYKPSTQPEILACGEGELIANMQKPTTRGKRAFTNPIDDYPPSFEVIDAVFPVDPMKSENDNVEYKNGCDDGYERKTGKWVKLFDDTFHCQLCGHTFMVIQGEDSMNYCPSCGARMEEEDE